MAVVMTQQLLAVDLISTVGYDGYFKSLNPAWERTLGYTAEELMSRPFLDFLHPDDVESTMAQYADLLATGADTIYFFNRYPVKAGGGGGLNGTSAPILSISCCIASRATRPNARKQTASSRSRKRRPSRRTSPRASSCRG